MVSKPNDPKRQADTERHADMEQAFAHLREQEPIQPSAELDAKVLAEAREAVAHDLRPLAIRRPWLSAAAVAVLAVLIVSLLPQEQEVTPLPLSAPKTLAEPEAMEFRPGRERAAEAELMRQAEKAEVQERTALEAKRKQIAKPAAPASALGSTAEMDAMQEQQAPLAEEVLMDEAVDVTSGFAADTSPIKTAEDYIREIEQLLESGQREAADKLFVEFKQHYPQHAFVDEYGTNHNAVE